MSSRFRAALAQAAAGLLVTSVSAAQVFRHPPHPDPAEQQASVARQRAIRKDPDQFGPLCCQILQIPAPAFTTIDPPVTGTMVSGTLEGYRFIDPGSGSAEVWAPLTLPSGVLVDFLDLYYKDTEPDNEICVDLVGMTGTTAPLVDVLATSCSTGSAGFGYASHLVAIQIDNDVAQSGAQYVLVVYTPFPSSFLQFKAVDVWWHRQVSPAPATATFDDVPVSHPFFQFVEALSASGITAGCGNNNFCPDAPLTRGQMAVFLGKALGLYWPF
jgi:hypothetical protein